MGISVLIPVYNFPVISLVRALATQLEKSGREGEIIVLDDGSDNDVLMDNEPLRNIPAVKFHANSSNEGRMAARIKLASLARFDHLLFLDGDSAIIKDDFVTSYFEKIDSDVVLLSGGRVYQSEPPVRCELRLHWKYGSGRENRRHGRQPAFMSNNFCVKKEVFLQLDQSPDMTAYGHEDSWWGIQFEKLGIECQYIDNPVLHTDLQISGVFLDKSVSALGNLFSIREKTGDDILQSHIRIYRWYRRLRSLGLAGLYSFFTRPLQKYFRNNLLSCKPSLFYFDCYRLSILITMGKERSLKKQGH